MDYSALKEIFGDIPNTEKEEDHHPQLELPRPTKEVIYTLINFLTNRANKARQDALEDLNYSNYLRQRLLEAPENEANLLVCGATPNIQPLPFHCPPLPTNPSIPTHISIFDYLGSNPTAFSQAPLSDVILLQSTSETIPSTPQESNPNPMQHVIPTIVPIPAESPPTYPNLDSEMLQPPTKIRAVSVDISTPLSPCFPLKFFPAELKYFSSISHIPTRTCAVVAILSLTEYFIYRLLFQIPDSWLESRKWAPHHPLSPRILELIKQKPTPERPLRASLNFAQISFLREKHEPTTPAHKLLTVSAYQLLQKHRLIPHFCTRVYGT